MIKEISATHLYEKMKSESCNIIDVREKVEFAMGHVPTAVNLPLSEFVSGYQVLDKDITYHIICQSGARSGQACLFLEGQGYNVVNIAGGTSAWPGVLEY
ncbi:rhodanese-like domain-containing protein [Streptococcus equinus]|uniref:rhodanese-like domain-containing protein n=1 Tax=Streptococcus equinus TaxID=1335 RepID=UPI003EEFABE6